MSAGMGCVDEQWREPLHPAVDHDVIDFDAPLGQQFFDLPVGESVTQIPRTATVITSGGSGTPRNWISVLAHDESDDASTKPA